MNIRPARLAGSYVVEPERHSDDRGFFARTYCPREFLEHGLLPCGGQWSVSQNDRRGTLRGMHFQAAPYAEVKLVRCARGAAWDVIVDLRPGSATFGQWDALELTEDNRLAFYIPEGFAHGFQTLADDTELLYAITPDYVAGAARGVRYDDPRLAIAWPLPPVAVSPRDSALPLLEAM